MHNRNLVEERMRELMKPIDQQIMMCDDHLEILMLACAMMRRVKEMLDSQLGISGRKELLKSLDFKKNEKPIVAQFFTSKPENMKKVAELAVKLGFDGIDINMGCPDKTIERQGAGACLMKTPKIARELIRSAKAGAGKIPVSVKTRVGFNKVELETWLPQILAEEPALVTVHARTRKEMSKVPANWSLVKRAVEIRNELKSEALIFGNGDVKSVEEALARVRETGCDGVMIGRGVFGNLEIFADLKNKKERAEKGEILELKKETDIEARDVPKSEIARRMKLMIKHSEMFDKFNGEKKSFDIMKKFFKVYSNGFIGAKDLRVSLMTAKSTGEVKKIAKEFIKNYKG